MKNRLRAIKPLMSINQPKPKLPHDLSNFRPTAPPSGPSCSRWFTSCSCCPRPYSTHPLFYTPNTNKVDTPPVPHREPTPHSGFVFPPPLPYSPTSIPFQRQLEILRQLSSDPLDVERSWQAFHMIHKELRRDIPDNIYIQLYTQQLRHPDSQRRYGRSMWLMRYAIKCGLRPVDLGLDNLRMLLLVAMEDALALSPDEKGRSGTAKRSEKAFRHLWREYRKAVGDISVVDVELRRKWLRVAIHRWRHRRPSLRRTAIREAMGGLVSEFPWSMLVELARQGSAGDLDEVYGEIFDFETATQTMKLELRRIVWCLRANINLPRTVIREYMLKYYGIRERNARRGAVKLREAFTARIEDLEDPDMQHRFREAYVEAMQVVRNQAIPTQANEKALSTETMLETLGQLVNCMGDDPDLPTTIDIISSLLGQIASRRNAQYGTTITRLLMVLQSRSGQARYQDAVQRLADTLLSIEGFPYLDGNPAALLFTLLEQSTLSERTFSRLRICYQMARAHQEGFHWSQQHSTLWRTMWTFALSIPYQHITFASRLYADWIADGQNFAQADAIDLIRAISKSTRSSKRILLERHLKDYVSAGGGLTTALIEAILDGLKIGEKPEDVLSALFFALRELGGVEALPRVGGVLVRLLARAADISNYDRAVLILSDLPASDSLVHSYNELLFSLVHHIRDDPSDNEFSRQAGLAQAVDLYKSMLSRHIRPTSRTISILMRGFLASGYIKEAHKMFEAALNQGMIVQADAVGWLVVHLLLNDKAEDAARAPFLWRELVRESMEPVVDYGVRGAEILLDVAKGSAVDLEEEERRTGWRPTAAFRSYLELLRRAKDNIDQVKENVYVWTKETGAGTGEDDGWDDEGDVVDEGQDVRGELVDLLHDFGKEGK